MPDCQKTALTVFFCFVFISPQLILQFYRGCPMVISKKTIIFGSNIFQGGGGGGPTFSWRGSNANFYKKPICNFGFSRGGGGGPDPLSRSGSAHYIGCHPGPTERSFGYTSILAIIRVICLSCFGALFVKVTLLCS